MRLCASTSNHPSQSSTRFIRISPRWFQSLNTLKTPIVTRTATQNKNSSPCSTPTDREIWFSWSGSSRILRGTVWNSTAVNFLKSTTRIYSDTTENYRRANCSSTPTMRARTCLPFSKYFLLMKISDDEYDLVMQNDTNTGGYTQWFNFMISNRKIRGTIKFRIINFVNLLWLSIRNRRFITQEWNRWQNLWCLIRIGRGVATTLSISWTKSKWRVARRSTIRL